MDELSLDLENGDEESIITLLLMLLPNLEHLRLVSRYHLEPVKMIRPIAEEEPVQLLTRLFTRVHLQAYDNGTRGCYDDSLLMQYFCPMTSIRTISVYNLGSKAEHFETDQRAVLIQQGSGVSHRGLSKITGSPSPSLMNVFRLICNRIPKAKPSNP